MGYKEQLTTVLEISAGLAAIAFLSQFAFSSKTRKQILKLNSVCHQKPSYWVLDLISELLNLNTGVRYV